jgi:hypothetical protein
LGGKRLDKQAVFLAEWLGDRAGREYSGQRVGAGSRPGGLTRFLPMIQMDWRDIFEPHWQSSAAWVTEHRIVLCTRHPRHTGGHFSAVLACPRIEGRSCAADWPTALLPLDGSTPGGEADAGAPPEYDAAEPSSRAAQGLIDRGGRASLVWSGESCQDRSGRFRCLKRQESTGDV